MDRTHAAALPTHRPPHDPRPRTSDGTTERLVEVCVLLVALVSGAVIMASNLVALLGG